MRAQREKAKAASASSGQAEEEFSADDALTKLYKRGKQFYVMGNTELALRHFREALKLDPVAAAHTNVLPACRVALPPRQCVACIAEALLACTRPSERAALAVVPAS